MLYWPTLGTFLTQLNFNVGLHVGMITERLCSIHVRLSVFVCQLGRMPRRCAHLCVVSHYRMISVPARETLQQDDKRLRGRILGSECPVFLGQWWQQPEWDPHGEWERKRTEMNLQLIRWGMDVPEMKWWSSLFSAKMKYDGEGAQRHFLPGTGSAHLELSAVCPLLLCCMAL